MSLESERYLQHFEFCLDELFRFFKNDFFSKEYSIYIKELCHSSFRKPSSFFNLDSSEIRKFKTTIFYYIKEKEKFHSEKNTHSSFFEKIKFSEFDLLDLFESYLDYIELLLLENESKRTFYSYSRLSQGDYNYFSNKEYYSSLKEIFKQNHLHNTSLIFRNSVTDSF